MYKIKKLCKMGIRRFFSEFGLHLIKSKYSRWQKELYPLQIRPHVPRYVNLGAGTFYHPFWHNVDMPNEYYSIQQGNLHVAHDFTSKSPLPFESDSVEVFYCSHVIEHLSDSNVQYMFDEVFRCLKPGGVFRITCPDMDIQYSAYGRGDKDFWAEPSPWGGRGMSMEDCLVEYCATALCHPDLYTLEKPLTSEAIRKIYETNTMSGFFEKLTSFLPPNINSKFPEGHTNWFSHEKLHGMLRKSGFERVINSRYLQSTEPKMRDPRLFDGTCPELSLYVECIKQ